MNRFKRVSTLAAVAAAAAVALAGCGPAGTEATGDEEAQPIVIASGRAVTTFDGDRCASAVAGTLVYGGLLKITEDGSGVEGDLAESFEYDEERQTYTFELRDTQFSNGNPLTSADVAFTVEIWQSVGRTTARDSIESVQVIDERTVEFTMGSPDSFLPSVLTWCSSPIYPEDFAGMEPEDFYAQPIGAGPYYVDSTTNLGGPNETVVLVKNEGHYLADEAFPTPSITFTQIADVNQRVLQFEAGEVDVLQDVAPSIQLQLPEEQLVEASQGAIKHVLVNSTVEGLSDVRLRQAISLAINRDDIVTALDGRAVVATGSLPNNLPLVEDPAEPYRYDPDAARELIGEAGLEGATFAFVYPSGDEIATTVATLVQSQLGEVGLTIELEQADAATVTSRRTALDYDLMYMSMSAISPSPFDPVSLLPYGRYPQTGGNVDVAEEQYLIGTSSFDPEVQSAAIAVIQDDAIDQMLLIGTVQTGIVDAVSDAVDGYNLLPYSNIFRADHLIKLG